MSEYDSLTDVKIVCFAWTQALENNLDPHLAFLGVLDDAGRSSTGPLILMDLCKCRVSFNCQTPLNVIKPGFYWLNFFDK